MKKNGLMMAGMIVILSAAGVLALSSLIAIVTARIPTTDYYYYSYHGDIGFSYMQLYQVGMILGGIMAFAGFSLFFAFSKGKGFLIFGIVVSAVAAFYCVGIFVAALSSGPVQVHPVLLGFIAAGSIAILVGVILRFAGVCKMRRQLLHENSAAE